MVRYRWQERTGESKWQWQWTICWPFMLPSTEAMARVLMSFAGQKQIGKGNCVCVCLNVLMFSLFSFLHFCSCSLRGHVSAMWAKVVGMQNMCNLYAEWLIRWNGAVINVALIDKVVVVVITVWANNRATKRSKHTWQLKASRWHTTRQNVIDCHWSEGGKEMPRGMYR